MKLLLGVNDIPYSQALTVQQKRTVRWRQGLKPWQTIRGTQTTGDIAEILERRYGIMGFFVAEHEGIIASTAENAMQGKIENLLMGAPVSEHIFEGADFSPIEHAFREMLDNQELDGRVPGVPTGAAMRGVSHRFAHPYARRASRQSFIDTGLYQANMRAWAEE